ncbi:hypothetical protein GYMLUDRAFT_48483 [Collybiopsis luxurians FD-317 M1]|uniref:Uncharacterized protein n=1 Tax=Collybiopsis luxurians FD-317 M1 TaxID=944289 RepID=A0A0D0BY66_9AGAR|nr:hypothetical protein GYMLUDRAFT_48483 [Collybiopsis luxurians FD-317 M1]
MTITTAGDITSVFDWDFGFIAPVLLSDPTMALHVDLATEYSGEPAITRIDPALTEDLRECSSQYFEVLFSVALSYYKTIIAGKDFRHLWFALRNWIGADPEGCFGKLGI